MVQVSATHGAGCDDRVLCFFYGGIVARCIAAVRNGRSSGGSARRWRYDSCVREFASHTVDAEYDEPCIGINHCNALRIVHYCFVFLQGSNRLQRGLLYLAYLRSTVNPTLLTWGVQPGMGHNNSGLYWAPLFRQSVYGSQRAMSLIA